VSNQDHVQSIQWSMIRSQRVSQPIRSIFFHRVEVPLAKVHRRNAELSFRLILWINVRVNCMLFQFRSQCVLEILLRLDICDGEYTVGNSLNEVSFPLNP